MKHTDIKTIELKGIKVIQSRSEETYCYEANVYINGKKAIHVSNGGHGAMDDQDEIIKGAVMAADEYFKLRTESATAIPKDSEVGVLFDDLEKWCSKQVTHHLNMKEIKRYLNRCFAVTTDKPHTFREWRLDALGRKLTPELFFEKLIQAGKLKASDRSKVLNFMDDETVFDVYYPPAEPVGGKKFWIKFKPEFDANGNCINIPTYEEAKKGVGALNAAAGY